jgi:hypothetical protein
MTLDRNVGFFLFQKYISNIYLFMSTSSDVIGVYSLTIDG